MSQPTVSIQRLHYGYITAPEGSDDTGQPLPVCGYVVETPKGRVLFDTGLSPVDDGLRERYAPRGSTVADVLERAGLATGDIDMIVNCHMHVDHAGGNSAFPDVPIYVQAPELRAAEGPNHTFPQYSFDFPGAKLRVIDGETEVVPGVRIVPTPGHTPGHQSLVVDTPAGPVLLAGQAFNTASAFGFAAFSHRLDRDGLDTIGTHPAWMERIDEIGPVRGLFAHDLTVFEPDDASIGSPQPL